MQNVERKLLIALGCLLAAVVIEAKLPASSGAPSASVHQELSFLPYHLGRYTGREAHPTEVEGYPGEIHRIYRQRHGAPVELVAFPDTINHPPENCLPYMGWTIIERGRRRLSTNPAIEMQTLVAVPDSTWEHPLVCGYYRRRENAAKTNLFKDWLEQRWSIFQEPLQEAEIVSICTSLDDVRQPGPGTERVYDFANALEPYFHSSSVHDRDRNAEDERWAETVFD